MVTVYRRVISKVGKYRRPKHYQKITKEKATRRVLSLFDPLKVQRLPHLEIIKMFSN